MMRYLLPQAVRLFMSQTADGAGSGSSVTFRQGLKDELVAALRRGEIDVVVGSVDPDRTDDDLRQELVLEDHIEVVAHRSHPLADAGCASLAQLAACQWVLPGTAEPEGERLTQAFCKAGHQPPQTAVRTGSSMFMASLLKDSPYLSYLPAALIKLDPDYGHLVAIPTEEPIWSRVVVGVTYRRRGVMLAPVRRFINRLKDVGKEVQATAW
jgi:DNA-binding transcriptional LysR family regulator